MSAARFATVACLAAILRLLNREVHPMFMQRTMVIGDGVASRRVVVEMDVRAGLPSMSIIGMPDRRVRNIRQTTAELYGRELPSRRITVNVAPASVRSGVSDVALADTLAAMLQEMDA